MLFSVLVQLGKIYSYYCKLLKEVLCKDEG